MTGSQGWIILCLCCCLFSKVAVILRCIPKGEFKNQVRKSSWFELKKKIQTACTLDRECEFMIT